MDFNKNITYYCFYCSSYTSILHELIYGSLYRQLSIKYCIQIPVCHCCHHKIHHGSKAVTEKMTDKALSYLKTDETFVRQCYSDKSKRFLLEDGISDRENKIKKLQV